MRLQCWFCGRFVNAKKAYRLVRRDTQEEQLVCLKCATPEELENWRSRPWVKEIIPPPELSA